MTAKPPPSPHDDAAVIEDGDIVEIVAVRGKSGFDPRAEVDDVAADDERPHKISDSSPPAEDSTELRDFHALARVLDRTAVPKRVRIEMVTAPLSTEAVVVLRAVDGRANVGEIIASSELSEDNATAGLQQLVELGVVAFGA